MTAERFCEWLAAMKVAGLARSDAECARMLGVTPTWLGKIKQRGTNDRKTALACQALINRLVPWGE